MSLNQFMQERLHTQGIDTWKKLPEEVVNALNSKSFERRIDNHWKDQHIVFGFKEVLTRDNETRTGRLEMNIWI